MKYTIKISLLLAIISMVSCNTWKGTLVDARDYHIMGATGGDHTYATYTAMRGNLPAAILSEAKEINYLCAPSEKLARYATGLVKVKGTINKKYSIIFPKKIYIREHSSWKEIYPKAY